MKGMMVNTSLRLNGNPLSEFHGNGTSKAVVGPVKRQNPKSPFDGDLQNLASAFILRKLF